VVRTATVVAEKLAVLRLTSQARTEKAGSMMTRSRSRTRILGAVEVTLVDTGVSRTAAAHVLVDGEPLTIVWSTVPVACTDWLLGDRGSQHPVRLGPDQVPVIWDGSSTRTPVWHAVTEVQCGVCGRLIGPWAVVRHGHLVGARLAEAADDVALLTDQDRDTQRRHVISHLTIETGEMAHQLATGALKRDWVPDLADLAEPGVGLNGDQVVGWARLPDPDGGRNHEVIRVATPIFETARF